jgi:HAD superfamily hydrolase (TIGR01549 family)
MVGVIFDLDETLVDTTAALEELTQQRWDQAAGYISQFHLYEGIKEVFEFLREHDIKTAIVSTSPTTYCQSVLRYFDIACECVVGKFDTTKKPSPDPMILALDALGVPAENTISFGDKAKDIESAKRANVCSVACTWGSDEVEQLIAKQPDFIIHHPLEAIQIISHKFSL